MSRTNAVVALLFAAAVWGLAFIFQKSATRHLGPLAFITARAVVAALALAPLALAELRRGSSNGTPRFWGVAVGGGVAFLIAAWLQQAGLETASVTNTGFLTSLYVVITPLLAWGWSRQPLSPMAWLAVALSAVGIWLLGGASFAAFSGGDVLVALSAFFWATHVIVTGRAASFGRPMAFTALQFVVVASLAAAGAAFSEVTTLRGVAAAAMDIAYVGLLSSAFAFTILTLALRHVRPAEAAVIVSLETVFAAAAAYVWLGERLSPFGWAGAALIVTAALLVQLGAATHRGEPLRRSSAPRGDVRRRAV
jgi:drug/metabolite transporter (DMT)-like permease